MSRYSESPLVFETGWVQERPFVLDVSTYRSLPSQVPAPGEVVGPTYAGMPYKIVLSVPLSPDPVALGRVANVQAFTNGYSIYQSGLTDYGRPRPLFWLSTDVDRYAPPPAATPFAPDAISVSVDQGGGITGLFKYTQKRGISLDPGTNPPAGYIAERATVEFVYSYNGTLLSNRVYLHVAYALTGNSGVLFPPLSDHRLHQCGSPRGLRWVDGSDRARLGDRYALIGPHLPGVSFGDPFYRSQLPSVWVGVPISGRSGRPRGWMRAFSVIASPVTYGGAYPQGGYELMVPHARDYPIAYAWVAPEQTQSVVRLMVDLRTARVRVFTRPAGGAQWSELGVGQTLSPIRCHQVVVYARQVTSAGYTATHAGSPYQLESFTHNPLYWGEYPQGGFPLATRVAPHKRPVMVSVQPSDGDDALLYFADLSTNRVRIFQRVGGHYEELQTGVSAPKKDVSQFAVWSDM